MQERQLQRVVTLREPRVVIRRPISVKNGKVMLKAGHCRRQTLPILESCFWVLQKVLWAIKTPLSLVTVNISACDCNCLLLSMVLKNKGPSFNTANVVPRSALSLNLMPKKRSSSRRVLSCIQSLGLRRALLLYIRERVRSIRWQSYFESALVLCLFCCYGFAHWTGYKTEGSRLSLQSKKSRLPYDTLYALQVLYGLKEKRRGAFFQAISCEQKGRRDSRDVVWFMFALKSHFSCTKVEHRTLELQKLVWHW